MQWKKFELVFAVLACAALAAVAHVRIAAAKDILRGDTASARPLERESAGTVYQWNVSDRDQPLLGLSQAHLQTGFDQSLVYPADQFDFLIFKALSFDEEQGRYLVPAISRDRRAQTFIEFTRVETTNSYVSSDGLELVDKEGVKILNAADGTRYLFVRYPDDEFRCAAIRKPGGETLNFIYTANGVALHGVVDSSRRSVTFNYGKTGIESLTQSWMTNAQGFTKTWIIGEENTVDAATRFAHGLGRTAKLLPSNALTNRYTDEMSASDKLLATIFGGPNAVVGGNGFEPAGLAASYPFYRGDVVGYDGEIRLGHLSHALHIYGSADGRGDSPLYVPTGFTSHSSEPSPTDAAVLFYYPKLGKLTDVTLAVFHVADFQLVNEGNRVRIGNLGGPGGSSPLYKHSHIEFYRGNIGGLPAVSARPPLRIDPATVFGK
jgi:hypothetical protein